MFRVFEVRPDGVLLHPLLCEQHALLLVGGYTRKCAESKRILAEIRPAPFTVACIATCTGSDLAFVFLREPDGTYFLFEMGRLEAWMLGVTLTRHATKNRPLVHQSIVQIAHALGGAVREVVIDQSDTLEYRAVVQIVRRIDSVAVTMRASDGIALALACGASLHVAAHLIAKSTWRAQRSTVLEELKRAERDGFQAFEARDTFITGVQQMSPRYTKCDVGKCAGIGEFRIFQYYEEDTFVHLVLCDRHARPIIERYRGECVQSPALPSARSSVACKVGCIATRDGSDVSAIYLRGVDAQCLLFMSGTLEGWMLLNLRTLSPEFRPLTHESMAAIIRVLDGTLREVVLDSVEPDGYRATLHILQAGRALSIEVPTVDGVALAAATGAPLHVTSELIRENLLCTGRLDVVERMKMAAPMLGDGT